MRGARERKSFLGVLVRDRNSPNIYVQSVVQVEFRGEMFNCSSLSLAHKNARSDLCHAISNKNFRNTRLTCCLWQNNIKRNNPLWLKFNLVEKLIEHSEKLYHSLSFFCQEFLLLSTSQDKLLSFWFPVQFVLSSFFVTSKAQSNWKIN